jgi:hypothetical protein
VSSRYVVLYSGRKVEAIPEGTLCHFNSSKILEGWFNIFISDIYAGTIPEQVLKLNFKVDPLHLKDNNGTPMVNNGFSD